MLFLFVRKIAIALWGHMSRVATTGACLGTTGGTKDGLEGVLGDMLEGVLWSSSPRGHALSCIGLRVG